MRSINQSYAFVNGTGVFPNGRNPFPPFGGSGPCAWHPVVSPGQEPARHAKAAGGLSHARPGSLRKTPLRNRPPESDAAELPFAVSAEQTCPICADGPMKARMVSEQTTGGNFPEQPLIPDGDARRARDPFCFLWPSAIRPPPGGAKRKSPLRSCSQR